MFKQISKFAGIGFASTLALSITTSNAHAFDFTFSFDNVEGNTPGTVEGIITRLNEGTGAADSVIITSFPAGLGGTIDNGNDATLWSDQFTNSFTVNSGSITAADFFAGLGAGTSDIFCLGDCGGNNVNFLSLDSQTTQTANINGFSGATYTAATPVPFGVSTDLSLLILGGTYGVSRLRKRMAANK